MPCYDHRNSPSYIDEHTVRPLRERNDQYAKWLCYLLTEMRARQVLGDVEIPPDLAKWWQEHQKFDKERKRK